MGLSRGVVVMAVAMLVATMLAVVPSAALSSAHAADRCGTGWHKQSNGSLGGSRSTRAHGRVVTARINGWVRFCTRNRGGKPDQRNQRVLVGVPGRVVSRGDFAGRHGRICLRQRVVVHAKRVVTGGSLSLSGAGAGASVNIGRAKSSTVRTRCAGRRKQRIAIEPGLLVATAPNGVCTLWALGWAAACYAGPKIDRVVIYTTATLNYARLGAARQLSATQQEVDVS